MFTFGLPRAKNSFVSIRKRFKLRGGSYEEASHVLTCLSNSSLLVWVTLVEIVLEKCRKKTLSHSRSVCFKCPKMLLSALTTSARYHLV